MKRVSILGIAGLLVLVLALAGCGGDDSGDDTTAAGGETTEATTEEAPSGVAEAQAALEEAVVIPDQILSSEFGAFEPVGQATVFHVACNLALQGCANQANGVRLATEAIGYEYVQCNGGTTADTIAQCFNNAVNANPDVIIPNGIGADVAGEGYAAAAQAGIPVVGMFTGNDPGAVEGVATEIAGETCPQVGAAAADWVIADSGGTANALFVGTETYRCNQQRQEAFLERMGTCTDCTTDTLTFAIDAIQSTLPQQLQAELQSNPDIDYIVGTFDAVALAAADAVRQAGRADSVQVGGFDADAPNLELIRAGDIQAIDVTGGTTEPGWSAVDAAARVIAGEDVPDVVDVTTVTVDASNIEEIGDAYVGPTGFEDQFRELWGM